MKLITSPAKLMTIDTKGGFKRTSTPKFINEATKIQSYLKEKSPQYLSELMEISSTLANENWERNQNWVNTPKLAQSTSALFAFTGEVYRGLDAQSLDDEALKYLNKNYRILSGLYGLLKPSDRIMLYRLEMGRPFEFDKYKNLYEFWKPQITKALNEELGAREIVLNLASNEYFKAIDKKELKAKVIDFDFYEMKSGTPKTVVVYTKHARGLMVRYCAENKVTTLDQVKGFNLEGYRIDEDRSSALSLVFTR